MELIFIITAFTLAIWSLSRNYRRMNQYAEQAQAVIERSNRLEATTFPTPELRFGDLIHLERKQMLVLSRKKNESIIIGDDVIITVVEIRGDKVRLGIEAPKHVSVHRREVYVAIQREKDGVTDLPARLPLDCKPITRNRCVAGRS